MLALAGAGIMFTLTSVSCQSSKKTGESKKAEAPKQEVAVAQPKPANEFQTTAKGLEYKIFKLGKTGRKPNLGDNMQMHFVMKTEGGEELFSTYTMGQPSTIPILPGSFDGDPMEGFALMSEGDSAVFRVSADSFFKDARQVPPGVQMGTKLSLYAKSLRVMSREEQQQEMRAAQDAQLAKDTVAIKEYIKANKLKAKRTASGLYYVISKPGNGPKAEPGKNVSVHYKGYLTDGTVFDESYKRGEPISFPLGQGMVIQGWEEGIGLMRKGATAKLLIPSTLGYGERESGPIPPNSVLIFDVELVDVK